MLKHIKHSRALTVTFKGPTNYNCSRAIVRDTWHNQSVTLSLSGADMLETVEEYLTARGLTITAYSWLSHDNGKAIIMLGDDFATRIK